MAQGPDESVRWEAEGVEMCPSQVSIPPCTRCTQGGKNKNVYLHPEALEPVWVFSAVRVVTCARGSVHCAGMQLGKRLSEAPSESALSPHRC